MKYVLLTTITKKIKKPRHFQQENCQNKFKLDKKKLDRNEQYSIYM